MTGNTITKDEALEELEEPGAQVRVRIELDFGDDIAVDPALYRKILSAADDNEVRELAATAIS
jgi:hypothetical protein